jgi:hypothetical protein
MLELRNLAASDAEQLVACFRECYGETYANEDFYDHQVIEQMVESGRLRSVVAINEGELVGHTGLTIRHPDAIAAEAGNTVVSPSMRGQGLLARLGEALQRRTVREGFVGYVHYPTTAHEIMQKSATRGAGCETGIMLAYIPAETEYSDFEHSQGRLAATIVYQPIVDTPLRMSYLPTRYAKRIRSLTTALGLNRRFLEPYSPRQEVSEVKLTILERRNLLQLSINKIGGDLPARILEIADATQDIVHADINLGDPGVNYAIDALSAHGFVYCGWLPNFGENDVLRLQRIDNLSEQELNPNLVNSEAKALLAQIKSGC